MNAVTKKYQPISEPPMPQPKGRGPVLLFFLMLTILGFYAHWKGVDFLVVDESGNVQISPQRQKELQKRLKQVRKAKQYALLATIDGYYPCFNCGQDSLIYLHKGEVWKYGVTYGNARYSNAWLSRMNLISQTEYWGNLEDCLIQEANKIYNYATLPENLKRARPLIRPPGNKVDR